MGSAASAASAASSPITLDKQYEALQVGIRENDQVSFKLLSLVPLVNGLALLGAVLGDKVVPRPSAPAIAVLSIFGAFVALGLFWWEIRNIQTSIHYISFAEEIMKLSPELLMIPEHIRKWPRAPGGLGKWRGEKLLYSTVVLTWLAFPIALLNRSELSDIGWAIYGAMALAGVVGTIWTVIAKFH